MKDLPLDHEALQHLLNDPPPSTTGNVSQATCTVRVRQTADGNKGLAALNEAFDEGWRPVGIAVTGIDADARAIIITVKLERDIIDPAGH
ncbi:hypothetical protein [Salisaeta longa]|uniref:hypothetical protein n=1 Tax=Salisaeta longa TaxID=503170 RepID=UPI0003B58B95|nr:hypothetical protein [Salisaeta longa]